MLDDTLADVQRAMDESPEIQIERKVDAIIRELDELCGLAANPETVDLIEGQKSSIDHIIRRSHLVASLLSARKPTQLRIVQNA